MAKLKSIKVGIKLPYIGSLEGTWEPDETERKAAWEMYVELVTRISVAEFKPGEGILREALSSLYELFNVTREILKKYGPEVARPGKGGHISFGYISVVILNTLLRPVLAKWHPLLLEYENTKKQGISPVEHELKWKSQQDLRNELNSVRDSLIVYSNILSQVANVPSLVVERK
jgi:hypothetical protein